MASRWWRWCGAAALVVTVGAPQVASAAPLALDAGREALHEGRHAEALVLLEEALRGDDLGDAKIDALHLMGRTALALELWAQAAEAYDEALADHHKATVLDDHLRWGLARARSELGDHAAAAKLYSKLRRDARSPHAAEAGYREGLAYLADDNAPAALKALKRFVDERPESPFAGEARARLAEMEATRGREDQAMAYYAHVARYAPDSRGALAAGLALEVPAEPQTRSAELDALEWLVTERRFVEALPRLVALRETAEEAGLQGTELRAMELQARSLREMGRTQEALDLYAELESRGSMPTSSYRLAWMHAKLGDHQRAEKLLAKKYGTTKSRAYWRDVADLRQAHGRYAEAEKAYRKTKGKRRDAWLERRIAWCVMRQGPAQADRALELLEQVGKRQSRLRLWSRYWRARTLQDAGRMDAAIGMFEALVRDAPLDYHGAQAASRLAEIRGVAPATRPPSGGGAAAGQLLGLAVQGAQALAGWVAEPPTEGSTLAWPMGRTTAPWAEAPTPAPLAEQLAALEALADDFGKVAPESRRALELARLGFVDEAAAELRVIDSDYRTLRRRGWGKLVDRTRSDLLDNRRTKKGRGGSKIGHLGRHSRKGAKAFRKASKEGLRPALRRAQVALGDAYALRKHIMEVGGPRGVPTEADMKRWRQAYPLAYSDAVATFSEAADVPPYFLYGIMTVESTFHPHAISVSDAYGLLQVIPRTGRRVAAELGYHEFSPELLLEPEVAIYMGSHYLGRVLRRFAGQEPLAAAAYNAGPHRVASWLDQNPDRPLDVFLEEIPYRQTRRYARSVLANTARYRRIYHDEPSMYVSNQLVARYTATPNY